MLRATRPVEGYIVRGVATSARGSAPFDRAMPIVEGPEGLYHVKEYTGNGQFTGVYLLKEEFDALVKSGQAFRYELDDPETAFYSGLYFCILRYNKLTVEPDYGPHYRSVYSRFSSKAQERACNIIHSVCSYHKRLPVDFYVEVYDVNQSANIEEELVKVSTEFTMAAARDGKWVEAVAEARFAFCVRMDVKTTALYVECLNRKELGSGDGRFQCFVNTHGSAGEEALSAELLELEKTLGVCTEEEPGTRLAGQSVGYLCTLPKDHKVDHKAGFSGPSRDLDRTWPRAADAETAKAV